MSILEQILTDVREEVAKREQAVPMDEVKHLAHRQGSPKDVLAVLGQEKAVTVIGEIKRCSPTAGELAEIPDPGALAQAYVAGGAAMIAVQTENKYYQGSLADLRAIRSAVDVPILQKDFIVNPYQLHESRAAGADMVLFMFGCVEQTVLTSLVERCHSLGMTALVEVHSRLEALQALDAGAKIIGVNGKNLKTLAENIENFSQIIDVIPRSVLTVAESGVKTPRDIFSYAKEGANAVLIGEAFVTAKDPKRAVSEMVAAGVHPALPVSSRKTKS